MREQPSDALYPAAGRRWIIPLVFGLFGLLVGTSFLYSGWLENAVLYYAPLVMALLLISLVVGIRRFQSKHSRWSCLAEAAPLLVALAALSGPYGFVWTWYRLEASRYPLPPDARVIEVSIDPVFWNKKPSVAIRFETAFSCREVQQFLISELTARAANAAVRSPEIPAETSASSPFYQMRVMITESRGVVADIGDQGPNRVVCLFPVGNGDAPPRLKRASDLINSW